MLVFENNLTCARMAQHILYKATSILKSSEHALLDQVPSTVELDSVPTDDNRLPQGEAPDC